jgi:hypothetical protein
MSQISFRIKKIIIDPRMICSKWMCQEYMQFFQFKQTKKAHIIPTNNRENEQAVRDVPVFSLQEPPTFSRVFYKRLQVPGCLMRSG